jgi:hypothetical protein
MGNENKNLNEIENSVLNIPDGNSLTFDDEKFIEALFAEYNKSYRATKEGQSFPIWFDDEQLSWVITVAKNCC